MIGTSARQVANRIEQLRADASTVGFYIQAAIEYIESAPTGHLRRLRADRFKRSFPKIEAMAIKRIGHNQYFEIMQVTYVDPIPYLHQFNTHFGHIILDPDEQQIALKSCDAQIDSYTTPKSPAC